MVPALHVEVLAVPWHGSSNTDHSHDHTISDSPKIAGAYESELNGEIFHELNSNRPPEASGNGIREDSSLSPHSEQNHTNNSESSSITGRPSSRHAAIALAQPGHRGPRSKRPCGPLVGGRKIRHYFGQLTG